MRDANANWPVNGHKGKTVLVAGMTAIVAENNAIHFRSSPGVRPRRAVWLAEGAAREECRIDPEQ